MDEIDIKKRSRKWIVVKTMLKAAVVVTAIFLFLMFYNYDAIAKTNMVWTMILSLLWGSCGAYAGIGQAVSKPKT